MIGRFAPSPTGPLHLGNLRTALAAWLFARAAGSRFVLRVEDLDPVASRPEHEADHLADLAALGLDWDGAVVRQSERRGLYDEALAHLDRAGLLYPCWCTRREIREAASAPHGLAPEGAYSGSCRTLSSSERSQRERSGRPAALRLRAGEVEVAFRDGLAGAQKGIVDDFVVRRNDGAIAYNLAVVVDDADQGIEQVVRGDDLLATTPRQLLLDQLLGLPQPAHVHLPLVLAPSGERLAKRDGAVTLADQVAAGRSPADVLALLAASLGQTGRTLAELVATFTPHTLPRTPFILPPSVL